MSIIARHCPKSFTCVHLDAYLSCLISVMENEPMPTKRRHLKNMKFCKCLNYQIYSELLFQKNILRRHTHVLTVATASPKSLEQLMN
jgi:hypothetical protein